MPTALNRSCSGSVLFAGHANSADYGLIDAGLPMSLPAPGSSGLARKSRLLLSRRPPHDRHVEPKLPDHARMIAADCELVPRFITKGPST